MKEDEDQCIQEGHSMLRPFFRPSVLVYRRRGVLRSWWIVHFVPSLLVVGFGRQTQDEIRQTWRPSRPQISIFAVPSWLQLLSYPFKGLQIFLDKSCDVW